MEEKKKGIGLIGLIGMVISSCIGSGVFAITGQLAGVASPGAVLDRMAHRGRRLLGAGVLVEQPHREAQRSARHLLLRGCRLGPLAGFISGWGYWLSAWLGNVAFATMMMSTIGYFYPAFLPGNTIPCIIIAFIVMWALTYLVIRGVESAAFLNAIVMVCKVAAHRRHSHLRHLPVQRRHLHGRLLGQRVRQRRGRRPVWPRCGAAGRRRRPRSSTA